MINSFGNEETKLIWNGIQSRKYPYEMQNIARRKLRMIAAAIKIEDLQIPPGNRLEKLKGNLENCFSIRINNQWRVVFEWNNGGAWNVRITDYH